MTSYWKATRPDGTDFYSGRIDYAAALASGEVIRHPAKKVRNQPHTHLSVSVEPADCTGFSWPCRLFRVEPVGRVMANLDASPNKRALSALRVVEEVPAWQALGPNGEAIAPIIEQARRMTPDEAMRLSAAWDAAGAAAWAAGAAARDAWAAGGAAWAAARDATWDAGAAAWDAGAAAWAAGGAAWAVARDAGAAAWDAAWALLVRDLISEEHFRTLYGPWASVFGWPEGMAS